MTGCAVASQPRRYAAHGDTHALSYSVSLMLFMSFMVIWSHAHRRKVVTDLSHTVMSCAIEAHACPHAPHECHSAIHYSRADPARNANCYMLTTDPFRTQRADVLRTQGRTVPHLCVSVFICGYFPHESTCSDAGTRAHRLQ